jgi:hypothetical protein
MLSLRTRKEPVKLAERQGDASGVSLRSSTLLSAA